MANDTLVLNPPLGFTGTSVEIKDFKQSYQLELTGVRGFNKGSATACFKLTGQKTPTCFPLKSNGFVLEEFTVQNIVVNKTDLGFQLNLEISAVASTTTITGRHVYAFVAIGSPGFTLPEHWTYTWASREP